MGYVNVTCSSLDVVSITDRNFKSDDFYFVHASGPVPARLWGIDNASKVCLHVVVEKPANKSLAAILERGFRRILL